MLRKVWAVAWLEILNGLRRYAVLGLVLFAFLLETGGLFFMDFIPRDIGRASADFILSVGWLSGMLFLFFHCVQVMAWDDERRTIHTLLARPISRPQYVLGVYFGLAGLLFLLNMLLGLTGYGLLLVIKGSLREEYFLILSLPTYALSWLGLFCIELMLLTVILLFSALVRGGFPVLILTVSYYLICTSLPVVRGALADSALNKVFPINSLLKWMTAVFPDFSRFDFKSLITEQASGLSAKLSVDFGLFVCFVGVALGLAAFIYQRRDLQ